MESLSGWGPTQSLHQLLDITGMSLLVFGNNVSEINHMDFVLMFFIAILAGWMETGE